MDRVFHFLSLYFLNQRCHCSIYYIFMSGIDGLRGLMNQLGIDFENSLSNGIGFIYLFTIVRKIGCQFVFGDFLPNLGKPNAFSMGYVLENYS